VHRALLSSWDLGHLLACLDSNHKLPLEGGCNAITDTAALLEILVGGPVQTAAEAAASSKGGAAVGPPVEVTAADRAATEALQRALVAAGGFAALVKVLQHRGVGSRARASALSVMHQLMAGLGAEPPVKDALAAAGAISALVAALRRRELTLLARSHAASCLYQWMAPEQAGLQAAAAGRQHRSTSPPRTAASGASVQQRPLSGVSAGAAGAGLRGESRGSEVTTAVPAGSSSPSRPTTSITTASSPFAAAAAAGAAARVGELSGSVPAIAAVSSTANAATENSGSWGPITGAGANAWPDAKSKPVIERAATLAQLGAVPALLRLCDGSSSSSEPVDELTDLPAGTGSTAAAPSLGLTGPVPEESHEGEGEDDSGEHGEEERTRGIQGGTVPAKKGTKKGKKKKKAVLEPGAAEAMQTATDALRLIALDERQHPLLLDKGAPRALSYVISSPSAPHAARWSARQMLLVLAVPPTPPTASAQPIASQQQQPAAASIVGPPPSVASLPPPAATGSRPTSSGVVELSSRWGEVGLPSYLCGAGVPRSHFDRVAPISVEPLPALPVVRPLTGGVRRMSMANQQLGSGGGAALAAAGSGSSSHAGGGATMSRCVYRGAVTPLS